MMGPVAPQPGNGKIQQKSKFERKGGRKDGRIPILESTLVFAHYILFGRELVAGLVCCLENKLRP